MSIENKICEHFVKTH